MQQTSETSCFGWHRFPNGQPTSLLFTRPTWMLPLFTSHTLPPLQGSATRSGQLLEVALQHLCLHLQLPEPQHPREGRRPEPNRTRGKPNQTQLKSTLSISAANPPKPTQERGQATCTKHDWHFVTKAHPEFQQPSLSRDTQPTERADGTIRQAGRQACRQVNNQKQANRHKQTRSADSGRGFSSIAFMATCCCFCLASIRL